LDVFLQWGEDDNIQALKNMSTMGDVAKNDDEVFMRTVMV
jgi:hypothetical protein